MKGLSRSFRAATRGFLLALKEERTFRVMTAAALLVVAAVSLLPLRSLERVILILVTGAVLVLELFNTTLERFVDLAKPRLSPYVRDVKDLMAAAVFVASMIAAVVGLLILLPYARLLLMI